MLFKTVTILVLCLQILQSFQEDIASQDIDASKVKNFLSLLKRHKNYKDGDYDLSVYNLVKYLERLDVEDVKYDQLNVYCNVDYPYRTIDGSCNNLENTWWGKAYTIYSRLANPVYDDRVQSPKVTAKDGSPLPNERLVSLKLTRSFDTKSKTTILSLSHGQLISHDISYLVDAKKRSECPCNTYDYECFNIPAVKGDELNYDQNCMSLSRSAGVKEEFYLKHREQINRVTHYMDLSVVYGSDEKTAAQLRKYEGGLLKTSNVESSNLDQLAKRNNTKCPYSYDRSEKCFKAGDERAEDNVLILSLHALWLREHNRLARKLAKINPYWDDETLYQEARRLNIAEYQHITSNEYWPAIFGEELTNEYGLAPTYEGYFLGYDKDIFSAVINEFAANGFRIYHSLVNDENYRAKPNFKLYDVQNVSTFQFNTVKFAIESPLEDVLHGMCAKSSYYKHVQINQELKNHLFEGIYRNPHSRRFDLFSINIHRGRDHGFKGYNHFREICGLNRAKDFDDLRNNIADNIIQRLREIYYHVDDIDLYAGLIAEKSFNGLANGYTSACINALQFRHSKYGDRFWYENGQDKNTRFTLDQLKEIKDVTIARVICDNTNVQYIQRNPFLMPDEYSNPFVECEYLPKLNLKPWVDSSRY